MGTGEARNLGLQIPRNLQSHPLWKGGLCQCPSIREETYQKDPPTRSFGVLPWTRSAQLATSASSRSLFRITSSHSLGAAHWAEKNWDALGSPGYPLSLMHESCVSVAVVALTDEPAPGALIKSEMVPQRSPCIPSLPSALISKCRWQTLLFCAQIPSSETFSCGERGTSESRGPCIESPAVRGLLGQAPRVQVCLICLCLPHCTARDS